MSANPSWTLDPRIGKYYYYSPVEQCYVYQDGTRIPYSSGEASRTQSRPPVDDNSQSLARQFANLGLAQGGSSGHNTASRTDQTNIITTDATGVRTTDPALLSRGIRAIRVQTATPGETEKLDPRFKVRKPANKFFKRGKVFRILWSEPAGAGADGSGYSQGPFQESFHTKIRWFVVIREGSNFCSCLPINTYGGQGVAKRSVVKGEHAIIYTGKEEPDATDAEQPTAFDEDDMQPSIRVKSNKRTERLDEMSRVHFAKVYTVEHNVKVHDFGDVHPGSVKQLVRNFRKVWDMDSEIVEEEGLDEEDEEEDEEKAGPAGPAAMSPEAIAKHNYLVNFYVTQYRNEGHHQHAEWLQHAPPTQQISHIHELIRQRQAPSADPKGKGRQ